MQNSINQEQENELINNSKRYLKEDVEAFFYVLDEILKTIDLSDTEGKIIYSCKRNNLIFMVGQRYCWVLSGDKQGKFAAISSEKLSNSNFSAQFDGSVKAYWNRFTNTTEVLKNIGEICRAVEIEINRTKKSSFKKFHNFSLEKAALDLNYRQKILQFAGTNYEPNKELSKSIVSQNSMKNKLKHPLNQILFGPPGTGKTYNTINTALEIIGVDIEGMGREEIKELYDQKIKEGQIIFTTFHQSMSYEDFIEGIKPETIDDKVIYNVKNGIFKNLCQIAITPNQVDFNKGYDLLKIRLSEMEMITLKTPTGKDFSISLNSNGNLSLHTGIHKGNTGTLTRENLIKQLNGEYKFSGWEGYFKGVIQYLEDEFNYSTTTNLPNQNFVLIIDEINRGNVSQIFGELITLIEEDKRLGKAEAIEVTLPYSKETFGVPPNLYILGTMNTADRSIESLDTALRRRFSFREMAPMPELIFEKGQSNGDIDGIDLVELLTVMNERIEKLLDKDHKIGHSYFLKVANIEDLRQAFKDKIIPLLEEYFFGDFGKIGLILGDSFIMKNETGDFRFANFTGYDSLVEQDLKEKMIYKVKESSEWDFSSIL